MRWLVEVTSLGKSDKESLFVDAESWQKALQAARTQRADSAPMSGFSIELLDDGCRAVDPVSRLRYEVRRAPDDLPAPRSIPPRPATSQPPMSQPPKKAPSAAPRAVLAAAGVDTAHVAPTAPPPSISAPPHALGAPRGDVAVNVPSQIIFKREQDATDALPMTYREYVYVVPPGTSEAVAETLLLTQLEMVRSSLERVASAKLVNLGVFDVSFQGKPPVPPLATLAWKDWRGSPTVTFPRRPRAVSAPPPPPSAYTPPPPPMSVAPAPVQHLPPPISAVPPPVQHLPPPISAVPPPVQHFPPPISATPPPVAAPPTPPPPPLPTPPPPPMPAFAPPAMPGARPQSVPPPPPGPRSRTRGEDLIADLFEAMHDLHFVRDALEGGEFCLALAMEKLPCQAGIVHLYEFDRREFIVASTRGAGASKLLLRRHPESDTLLLAAVRKRRAIVVADGARTDGGSSERYGALGGARSLLIAPVILHGRTLGAIELLNPLDGQPFNESEGNALTYIAEQFAEFISSHGIVTDPDKIRQRQPADA